jgi:hypothetical protein
MARRRIARLNFALAIIALPFTYAVKDLLGYSQMTWVDPTLILALAVFALVGWQLRKKPSWFLIVLAFLSAALGWYLHKVEPGHFGHPAWYVVMAEPISLTLNLVWFWVCIVYFVRDREFAVRWLSISVIFQLIVAVYFYLAMFDLLPSSASVGVFLQNYRLRQALWLAGAGIPRMGGTFYESPLFGLFMLSCLVVLGLEVRNRRAEHRPKELVLAGAAAAGIGTLASLSDQVLIGAAVFLVALSLERLRKPGLARWAIALPALLLVTFEASRIHAKRAVESTNQASVYGQSLGEREFNARYSLTILANEPEALFLGIGPNRFGDYATAVPMYMFESTVTPQVAAVEWLIGYGVIGFLAIALWLYEIGKRAWAGLGYVGLAAFLALLLGDMFQARWLWESWFMALAYLYASPAWTRLRPARVAVRSAPLVFVQRSRPARPMRPGSSSRACA